MGTYTKSIGKFEVPQTVFKRIVKEVFDNGACQCFKDCDCAADKGKRTEKIKIWYRNIKFDDTGKCFYSEPYTPPQITI